MGKQYLTSTRKIKVYANALESGMFVCDLDRPWIDTPFLLHGFTLESAEDIKDVQNVCDYVYVDLDKSNRRGWHRPMVEPKKRKQYAVEKSVEDEFENALQTYKHGHSLLKSTMEDIRFGNTLNTIAIKEIVTNSVESILRNPSAMHLIGQIEDKDEGTSQHSLNVCILSVMLGRQLGLDMEELTELAYCGLLHDIGVMRTPQALLYKDGGLSRYEFEIMQQHTVAGMEILTSTSGVPRCTVAVAHGHHERVDGRGYPRGLKAEAITPYARAVAIADTYEAVTNERAYRDGRPHLEALNILAKGRGTQFDPSLAINFIACIGIYPPGCIVELKSGEVGIVIDVTPDAKAKPRILLVLDQNKKPCRERILDLAHILDESTGVRQVLKKSSYGIDLKEYLEKGLVSEGLTVD